MENTRNLKIYSSSPIENRGILYFKNAKISWLISISNKYLKKGMPAKRELIFDRDKIQLSDNFNNLHIKSYMEILKREVLVLWMYFQALNLLKNSEVKK